jgi:ABC-type multidrug transport system, ATPase and permease components
MIEPFVYLIKLFMKESKWYVLLTFVTNFIRAGLNLIAVVLPGLIIGELVGNQQIGVIAMYVGIYLGISFFGGWLANLLERIAFVDMFKAYNLFGVYMADKNLTIDMETLEDSNYLDITQKSDRFMFNGGFGSYFREFSTFLGRLFIIIGLVVIIINLNVWISMVFISLLTINFYVDKEARKKYAEIDLQLAKTERKTKYFGEVAEKVEYGKEVRLFGMEKFLLKKWNAQKDTIYHARKEQYQLRAKVGYVGAFVSFIRNIITYIYLIYSVLNNQMTIASFTIYLNTMLQFSEALSNVLESFLNIQQYSHYFGDFKEYLGYTSKMRNNEKLPVPSNVHTIEFKNVSFKYLNANDYSLRNINLVLRAGEKLAIVGENGAGKTTFIKLLCRLYDPTEGVILLNGRDIRSLDYDEYMKLLSSVFQDFQFFALSVKENIIFSDNVEDQQVENLLKKVGLEGTISKLKKGIHTSIYKEFDEDGFEPSGGEGQKLALARALYRNAPIVILDEPTAALDPRAEFKMYHQFNELVEGRIAIFISHRLSSTKFCDKIAFFSNKGIEVEKSGSTIIEFGSHEELMAKNDYYKDMFQLQAQFYV